MAEERRPKYPYTPQVIYPRDELGREKYLIDELNKISQSLSSINTDGTDGGDVMVPPGSDDCWCIKMCQTDSVPTFPQNCQALDEWYTANPSNFTFHTRAYFQDDYVNFTGSGSSSNQINTLKALNASEYNYDTYRALGGGGGTLDDWDDCGAGQLLTDFPQTTGASYAVQHRAATSDPDGEYTYFGDGDNCTFHFLLQDSSASPRTRNTRIAHFRGDIQNGTGFNYNADLSWIFSGGDDTARVRIAIQDTNGDLNYASVYSPSLYGWDANGDRRLLMVSMHMVRTTSTITLNAWCNGEFLGTASDNGSFVMDTVLGDPTSRRYPAFGSSWSNETGGSCNMIHMSFQVGQPSEEQIDDMWQAYQQNTLSYVEPPSTPGGDPVFEVGDVLEVSEVDPDTGIATWCPTSGPFKGYGSVSQTIAPFAATLGAGYTVLLSDQSDLNTPVAVIQDAVNNGLIFEQAGVWSITSTFTIGHDSANDGRTFNVEIYNSTDAVSSNGTTVGVGRNVEYTNYSASMLVDVPESAVGDLFQIRIGGTADTFITVTQVSYTFNANKIGGI